ncbi:ADP-ribosylation factor [Hamiltosporidium magnivora]|uniref:ADP-ribosylation factor n=1 Tax=Hamiltosporidium magnivora TaxID=148818 RepID=A0A4Q9L4G6_9MICR|nr:ADP-ribosylation factor [Hamiltosporidium magnivora]
MGQLCSDCCKRPVCRIVILGLDEAGKMHLYSNLTNKKEEHKNELVYKHDEIKLNGMSIFLCSVLGDEKARNLWSVQIQNSDGIIFVVDISNEASYKEITEEFQRIMDVKAFTEGMNILLLCNNGLKTDREYREVGDAIFSPFLENPGIRINYCSIEEWLFIDDGLEWLCERIKTKNEH